MDQNLKKTYMTVIVITIILSSLFGSVMGFWSAASITTNQSLSGLVARMMGNKQGNQPAATTAQVNDVDEESNTITTVGKVSPAVVSVIITKNLPVYEQYFSNPAPNDFFQQFFGNDFGNLFPSQPQYRQKGTQQQEVGGGSGFIITTDGYIVTNKHVVSDEQADYTVVTNDGKKYPAKVLARDPVNDLAILKIDAKNLPVVELGDSSKLKVGQTVIAIGNALGEFRNTVSKGVISGLARSITAGGAGFGSEDLAGVIQTDASINPGNSGGPLLNIAGQVIGINTAVAQDAQGIGFALPINSVKASIASVEKNGRIIRPWLGVRYQMVTKELKDANKLSVDYGALVIRGQQATDLAVVPGSPADKAGIVENDILLEINGKKLTDTNTLSQVISGLNVGDTVTVKVLDKGKEKVVKIKLEEMK